MVHLCVTKIGPMPPVFCPAKAKVNADKFIELLALDVIPNIVELADLNTATWQEDNATARAAKKKTAPLRRPSSHIVCLGQHNPPTSRRLTTASTITSRKRRRRLSLEFQSQKQSAQQ